VNSSIIPYFAISCVVGLTIQRRRHANGGRAPKGTPAASLILTLIYAVAMTAVFS
jgi:hypothetical protein